MIQFSKQSHYAILALLHLNRSPDKRFTIAQISKSQDISSRYLEITMKKLNAAGLVDSLRGANGGYTAIKNSDQITIYDILCSIESNILEKHIKNSDELSFLFKILQEKTKTALSTNLATIENERKLQFASLHYQI